MAHTGFSETYRQVVENGPDFGARLDTLAKVENILAFLYEDWWSVNLVGLQNLPKTGPALFVGNTGPVLPWPGLMLMYALMSDKTNPRQLHILADLDAIEDERLYNLCRELGFVSWSAQNVKRLFTEGQLVAIFPEGAPGRLKPFSERYRLRNFDWTRLLPAIESKVPIYPLATLGCDEAIPLLGNLEKLANWLSLPSLPMTPFFPLLPFPANLMTLPVHWEMRILKAVEYNIPKKNSSRDDLEDSARALSLFLEGEVQAEVNRRLRARFKSL